MASPKKYKLTIKSKRIQVVADKVLLLRLMRRLHGRVWGIFGLVMLEISLVICFIVRPDLRKLSTAFSDFGTDIQTAPFFIAGVFIAAYGLWRWRNYVSRTFKNPGVVTLLITMIIIGLYLTIFMPVGINDTIDDLHYFGFALAGASMALTVLADLILRKSKKTKGYRKWQLIRLFSLVLILAGIAITIMSANRFNFDYDISLVGESMLLTGFGMWVIVKTYQGDGARSRISRLINKVLIIQ